MIILYNILLALLLIIFSPFMLFKSIANRRFRYRFLDRIFPKTIKEKEYFLFHASSFGEVKTVLSFLDLFEEELNSKAVISVFTDTGYKQARGRERFLMPIDLIPLHRRVLKNPPNIAIFFEAEIWPSYIHTLKSKGVKIVLINARMSENSFKQYKNFSFFFKKIISQFDLIISKSKIDARRYRYFSNRVIVCGNIKSCVFKLKQKEQTTREDFLINSEKDIMVLASFHKEEMDIASKIIQKFRDRFFFVVAPRHMEDVELFENHFKKKSIEFTKRTESKNSNSVLLLDTLGELTKVYSFSTITILGGSFNASLKGHNPLEPTFYNNILICGPYMESFKEEVEKLKKINLIYQIDNKNIEIEVDAVLKTAKKPAADGFFRDLSYILNCHLFNTTKTK